METLYFDRKALLFWEVENDYKRNKTKKVNEFSLLDKYHQIQWSDSHGGLFDTMLHNCLWLVTFIL